METDAYISLGSNLGDRELNLLMAIAELGKLAHCRITAVSSFYETSAVGMEDETPAFHNAVVRLSTTHDSPVELLHKLQQIEREKFDRQTTVGVQSRKMDLDLLLFGKQILATDELTLPHPRMTRRKFVLVPLLEIAPDFIDPASNKKLNHFLQDLPADQQIKKVE